MNTTPIDLRSDTVTRPTAAMRAAMMAAPLGDDVFGDDPDGQRAAGPHRGDARQGGGAVHAVGHAEQPVGADGALPARRRIPRRPGRAHLPLRRRRRRGARQHPAAADRQPARRLAGAGRHRGGDQARRRALRAHAAAVPGEHVRRPGAAASTTCAQATDLARRHGLATHLDGARLFNAAVALARWRRRARKATEMAQLFDSVSVCFSKGLGAPVGSALVGTPRADRTRAPHAQDARRRHAPGRRAGRGGAACARPSHRPPRRRPCATPSGWPKACRAWPACSSAPAKTNMVFVDLAPGGSRHDTVARAEASAACCAPACTGCAS